jgi:molecular chaperone HscB
MPFDFSRNYFDLFGLAVDFNVDRSLLNEQYQTLQGQHHPDKFVQSDDAQRRLAVQITAHLNQAQDTLKDEHARARYLLTLRGVSFHREQDTTKDMDFLMAQMELREQIDEVSNDEQGLDHLDKLARQAKQQKNDLIQRYQELLADNQLEEAKELVLKLQFFGRLQSQISAKQEQLEDQFL